MNLLEIRTQARKRLGDASGAFWSDSEINTLINDGARDISFRTKCIRRNGYITTFSCDPNTDAPRSNEYPLRDSFPNIYAVLEAYYFHDDEWIRLQPKMRDDLDFESDAWRGNVGYTKSTTTTINYNITNATQANPVQITAVGHGRSVDDEVIITLIGGMTELEGNSYLVNSVVDADNITLKTLAGVPVDSTGFGAYTSGGILSYNQITFEYNYNSKTSVPIEYYWSREEDIIGLNPPPDDSNAGANYLRVYRADVSTDITVDSEEPEIPEPLHRAIIDFVAAAGFEDRGWGDRANDQWTKYYNRLRDYEIERDRERHDEEIIMKNYRNM